MQAQKYNILLLIDSLLAGGAEKVLLTLSREFFKRGHTVTLLNLSSKVALEIPEEINVINCNFAHVKPRKAAKYVKDFLKLYHSLENSYGAFDFVLGNLPLAESFIHVSKIKGCFLIHCILSHHIVSNKKSRFRIFKKKLCYKNRFKGRQLIFCSNYAREDAGEFFSLPKENCTTIYNPIDIGLIKKKALETKPKDLPSNPYIIHVGSFTKVKRHDKLIHAYKHSGISAELVLIGVGPEESAIRKLVATLGLENKVHFLGLKNNPFVYMRHAQLFISSSDSEALPTVIIEALICETFVVATKTLGAIEILKDYMSDSLCEIGNTIQLGALIRKFYFNEMKIDYSKIYNRFSADKIALEYETFIDSMKDLERN